MNFKILLLAIVFGFFQSQIALGGSTDTVVIDVRTPEEYHETHVAGSLNIDFLNSNFKTQIEKLDKNKNYKVYCRSGNRSGKAEMLMRSMGFKNVENIGSVKQAAKKLGRNCEGQVSC